jgi:hypothetical protein
LENLRHVGKYLPPEVRKLGATVINGRQADGSQYAIRHRRGPWNLQEVTSRWVKIELVHRRYQVLNWLGF